MDMEDIAHTIRLRKAGLAGLCWLEHCRNHELTNLFKFVYYLDFSKTKQTGKPFFNFHYTAEKFGPVPVEIDEAVKTQTGPLFEYLVIAPYTEQGSQRYLIGAQPSAPRSQDLLSNLEKSHLEQICFLIDEYRATDLSRFTHVAGDPWDRIVKSHGLHAPIDIREALTMSGFDGDISAEEAEEKISMVRFLETCG